MRVRSLIALCLVVGAAMACNEKALEGVDRPAEGGAPTGTLSAEESSKVLARVGDHAITVGEYVAALEHIDQFDRLRYQSPERRKELLSQMIDLELLAAEAKRRGYDQEPQAQQEVREILRDALLQRARKGAPGPSDIPDAEIRAYYDAHREEFRDAERRRVSVIVLPSEAAAEQALDAAKKTTTPKDWGEIVKARSVDPQAKANVPVDLAGDQGMVSAVGDPHGENTRVPDAVRAAVFEIAKVGDVFPRVVHADIRYFVVKLTQKTDAHDRTYAEAERSIRVKLVQEKLKQRDEDLVTALRAKFPVQIDEAALAKVAVDLSDAGAGADGGGPSPGSAFPRPQRGGGGIH
jgi:peptidyl-prolyl cis-trans isomerase C